MCLQNMQSTGIGLIYVFSDIFSNANLQSVPTPLKSLGLFPLTLVVSGTLPGTYVFWLTLD